MSMPEDTPAAVTIFPSITTRSFTGVAPCRREVLEGEPIGGGPLALQQAGGTEHERAGAHGRGPRGRLVGGPQPVEDGLVLLGVGLTGPAGHEEDVRVGHVGQGRVGDQRQGLGVGALGACLRRHEGEVGVGQARQHLVGPDGVEGREAVEEQDGDVHGGLLGCGQAARKRRRYSVGLVRSRRRKVRRIVSAVPKPAAVATASTPSSVSSSSRRAVSTRTPST